MAKKIAIPTNNGMLSRHFGHCEVFVLFSVNDGKVIATVEMKPPLHEPGSHPRFLKENGCDTIIAAGMGMKAQELFSQHGINVIVGAPLDKAETVLESYLQGKLTTGQNLCEH